MSTWRSEVVEIRPQAAILTGCENYLIYTPIHRLSAVAPESSRRSSRSSRTSSRSSMASHDIGSVPNEYGSSSNDRPMHRMSEQVQLTPNKPPRGNLSTTSSNMPVSSEELETPQEAMGQAPQQGLPMDSNQGRVGEAPTPGRSRRGSRSPRPKSRARPNGEEHAALRRWGQDTGAENPYRSTLVPMSRQFERPTGVIPVGLSVWPAGLNPAVPLPTWPAGVMPAGPGGSFSKHWSLHKGRRTTYEQAVLYSSCNRTCS